jgi:hypothetical protein
MNGLSLETQPIMNTKNAKSTKTAKLQNDDDAKPQTEPLGWETTPFAPDNNGENNNR